jgi:gas vesicle protein
MRRVGFLIMGAVIGGVLGSTLALLLTPSSGPKLRVEINNRLEQISTEIKKAALERRSELEKQITDLRSPRV